MQQSIENKDKQIFNRAYKTRTSRQAIEHAKEEQADMQQSIQKKNKQICNGAYRTGTTRYSIEHTKQE